jgi:maltose alpha-D-glucosyltransferase/alpha-amylase
VSDDPLWFKDAIVYQLRIPSFYDSDGDGIGDLRGLTEKLDYLRDLGVTTLWLLPFYPSPLRDDGYDIADYTDVHPDYGTLRDFRTLLREAHRRDLRVVTELVLNHTSDQHAWFQRSRRAPPGSRYRDYYVWNDSPQRYAEARIIFKDFESSNWAWDPTAQAYYWHRFYSHQPDLNCDNPEVRRALLRTVDFWLEMGVDGMRLDAVPYLFEREGTSCENLPETHAFLRELRGHVDARFPGRMLLAEANQWPEDAVAYFGKGDECHMAFHFPVMPRLFMAIHMEDRYPILDILEQTPTIPETCQWALFLRNHDELTLEMVTDEERDYMWRVYAKERRARINLGIRRRLAPLLENNRRKIELMNALLCSLPGTPIVYYGDEIGMGDNVFLGDRNGVRTPMQWSPDRNAGFSRANPQRLFLPVVTDPEYHYEAVNVETQQANPSSLLWWTKRFLSLRRRFRAFGRGSLEPLTPSNRRVLAFVRRYEEECLLVVANLSRFAQYVELDLSRWKGCIPVELFGHAEFPPIGDLPYLLTLGPHAFYWFSITPPREGEAPSLSSHELPLLRISGRWQELVEGDERRQLEAILPPFLSAQRWFRSKGRSLRAARIVDSMRIEDEGLESCIAFVRADFAEGQPETYALPLALARQAEPPPGAMARVRDRNGAAGESFLKEASGELAFARALMAVAGRRRRLRGRELEIRGVATSRLRSLVRHGELTPHLLGAEQSNTSWIFGEACVGKLLRKLDEGASPDLEISRHLSEGSGFPHSPPLLGHLEVQRGREEPATLALFHGFVPNEGDSWTFTLDELERFLEEVLARPEEQREPPPSDARDLLTRAWSGVAESAEEAIGSYLDMARLLGRRTGELHAALASDSDDPAFAPEPLTPFVRRAFFQSLRNLAVRNLDALREALARLDPELRAPAQSLLEREGEILARLRASLDEPLGGRLIRCHGDYHLGQVLYTGRDFAIIDFEGEPARSLAERRRKRSPFADVAGMLRSFQYAAETVIGRGDDRGDPFRREDFQRVRPWAKMWAETVSAAFLGSYLGTALPTGIVPAEPDQQRVLLELHLVEKALYELGYEVNNRPDWVAIPLRGLLDLIGPGGGASS